MYQVFCAVYTHSSVGIATGYGLDCRGSIPGRDSRFSSPYITSRPAVGSAQPPIQWVS
jgi:hypothetical protein